MTLLGHARRNLFHQRGLGPQAHPALPLVGDPGMSWYMPGLQSEQERARSKQEPRAEPVLPDTLPSAQPLTKITRLDPPLGDKEVEAADRALAIPIHARAFAHETLELFDDTERRPQMTGRAALKNAGLIFFELPSEMMVDIQKSQIAQPQRDCPHVKVNVLPTQQLLIETT